MSSYDRELIEKLLPTIWDDYYVWGMDDERRPDPDMPTGTKFPKWGNTHWAHLIDIRRAWGNTPLPLPERRALFLVGAFGMTHSLAAYYEGAGRSSITERFERGVGRLADYLNGTDFAGEYEDDD